MGELENLFLAMSHPNNYDAHDAGTKCCLVHKPAWMWK